MPNEKKASQESQDSKTESVQSIKLLQRELKENETTMLSVA